MRTHTMITTTLLALLCATAFAQQKGTFKDTRDGKTYKTVKIGEQVWMAENLNYNMEGSVCYGEHGRIFVGIIFVGKLSAAEIRANCTKYGRLYVWKLANSACPAGWHLPSDNEWITLTDFVGGKDIAAKKLKAKSGWKSGNGTDDYGFSALPGSYQNYEGNYSKAGNNGNWWGSGNRDAFYHIDGDYVNVSYNGNGSFSVRCIQDDANYFAAKAKEEAEAEAKIAEAKTKLEAIRKANGGEFTDTRDKKTYLTIKIGKQTWMAENLNYNAKGSKCYIDKEENCEKYGRLYTWEQANSACPNGWHLSSNVEWRTLTDFVGGDDKVAGKKLKATSGWYLKDGSGNGTDEFGFSALPDNVSGAHWWTEEGSNNYTPYMSDNGYGRVYSHDKNIYYSVRCVKGTKEEAAEAAKVEAAEKAKAEAKAKAEVEAAKKANSGTFTDSRDKKKYKTIKIGTQTWMAENLNYNAKDSKCYDNKPDNCDKFGRLYSWEQANSACPNAWHLPNNAEWTTLTDFVVGDKKTTFVHNKVIRPPSGDILKATIGWNKNNFSNSTDEFGFSALPGGGFSNGKFGGFGNYGYWWRSSTEGTEDKAGEAYYKFMSYDKRNVDGDRYSIGNDFFYSVRCLKDK